MSTRTEQKVRCMRCHGPLDHNELVFCLHCQFIVDEFMKDSEPEPCRVCGDTRPNNPDGTCPGCGSI